MALFPLFVAGLVDPGSGAAASPRSLVAASSSHAADRIAGGVPAPALADIDPVCGDPGGQAAPELGPSAALPVNPETMVVAPVGGLDNFAVTSNELYVNTGTQVITYTLSGTEVSAFALPAVFGGSSSGISAPVVGSTGDIYLASYYGMVVDAFSPSGRLLWSVDPEGGNPTGIFNVPSTHGFKLAVSVTEDHAHSQLLSASGVSIGTFPLVDAAGYVTTEANGDFLYAAGGTVDTFDPTGRLLLSSFGSKQIEGNGAHTGGPYQFYIQGQAVDAPDGVIYTADLLRTIEATSQDGLLAGSTTLGGTLTLAGPNLYLAAGNLYYEGGTPFSRDNNVSEVSLNALDAYLAAPQAPLDTLGWGAGLDTPVDAGYFAPGTVPQVFASFSPSWARLSSSLVLDYSVEDTSDLASGVIPQPTIVNLPKRISALATVTLPIPKADSAPGPYQVQATLYDTSSSPPQVVGSTCLPYTVGSPGDRLDLSTLPAGLGAGGPPDPRGVVLNSELGLDGFRGASINWSTFLPLCLSSAPTAATCGPSAMTFTSAPASYFQAAYLALHDNVTYWVQVTGGDPISTSLIGNGWWQADISALVRYYTNPPADCVECAPVMGWEPWNEPNNNGWPVASEYVSQVLKPFYLGVKSANSSATVIGGSTLGIPLSWWTSLIEAGGLSYLDVAAIHPYTGNNDSWEEFGTIPQIQSLEAALGNTPLWMTEVGWWSNDSFDFLQQANIVARAMLWQKALNIPVWNYYFDEGNWGNDGVTFSLIQTGAGDDWVKPAALAAMATANELAGRNYLSMPSTGIPDTYEAMFSPSATDPDQLAAVWSDDLSVATRVVVTSPRKSDIPVTLTTEYGNSTSLSVHSGDAHSLTISGQVTYISYPAGDSLSVTPTEAYGQNVALASAGATATASSGSASAAISGVTTGAGWMSSPGDVAPTLTVSLGAPTWVDRAIVDTQSVGSTATGLRKYKLSVEQPDGDWSQVAAVSGQYRDHNVQLAFTSQLVIAVRISISEINYGGYYGGGVPPFWPASQPGVAFLHDIEVYSGLGGPGKIEGANLPSLLDI
jgi:hypothetical protein